MSGAPEIDRAGWTEHELEAERQLNAEGEEIERSVYGAVGRRRMHGHGHYVLDRNNVAIPCGLGTWAIWFEVEWRKHKRGEPAQTVVKQENVGEYFVSTVFLGLDHSFPELCESAPRALFETMVFPKHGQSGHDLWMDRYPTWDTAARGHADVAARLRAGTLFDESEQA